MIIKDILRSAIIMILLILYFNLSAVIIMWVVNIFIPFSYIKSFGAMMILNIVGSAFGRK